MGKKTNLISHKVFVTKKGDPDQWPKQGEVLSRTLLPCRLAPSPVYCKARWKLGLKEEVSIEVLGRTPLPCRLALTSSSVYCNVRCKPFSHGKESAWSCILLRTSPANISRKYCITNSDSSPDSFLLWISSRIIQQFMSYIITMLKALDIGQRIDMSSICPGKIGFGWTLSNPVFDIHSHKVSALCHQQRVTRIHEAQSTKQPGFPERSTNPEKIIWKSCKHDGWQVGKYVWPTGTGRLVERSISVVINMGWLKSRHTKTCSCFRMYGHFGRVHHPLRRVLFSSQLLHSRHIWLQVWSVRVVPHCRIWNKTSYATTLSMQTQYLSSLQLTFKYVKQ